MIRRLASIGATAVAVVAVAAAPAQAADELGLSRDGVSWATALSEPLFTPDFRFVPGDVEVREFRVRNDGPSEGVLSVDVVVTDPDALLATDDFVIEARVDDGPWRDVDPGTMPLVTELAVPQGQQSRVQVRATFAWESTVQDQSVPFRLDLTLSESGEVGGIDDGNGNGNGNGGGNGSNGGDVGGVSDVLPSTGAGVGVALLWLAAGLVGAGTALARRGRGREEVAAR